MSAREYKGIFLRGVTLVVEKNLRVYANKPPVIIFGLLFPLFMFLAFYFGRNLDVRQFFPGFLGMSLFFLSTSIGPLITPWEKFSKTYERLLSFPLTIKTIILADIITGIIVGTLITSIILIPGILIINYKINIIALITGLILGASCFSSLGTFLSSPDVPNPSHIMIRATLVRFPLIFISGIFVPLENLHGTLRVVAHLSPITYLVDVLHFGLKGELSINLFINFSALILFSMLFFFLAHTFHKKNMMKGF